MLLICLNSNIFCNKMYIFCKVCHVVDSRVDDHTGSIYGIFHHSHFKRQVIAFLSNFKSINQQNERLSDPEMPRSDYRLRLEQCARAVLLEPHVLQSQFIQLR